MIWLGAAAGLGTACAWAISNMVHAEATRSLGVHPLMMLRQLLAVIVLTVACLAAGQVQAYPLEAVGLAFVSGVLGVVICDWCLYEGILRIGIRSALICQSLYSCVTALFGALLLGEHLGMQALAGICIATLGVILVIVSERRAVPAASASPARRRLGIALSLCAAVTMALGLVFTKMALQGGIPPLTLSLLRNLVAAAVLWSAAVGLHRIRSTAAALRGSPKVIRLLLVGCLFGPTGGIWLSTVALAHAPAAVAATLIGLQPVALLVVSGLWERRCPSYGSIIGSCTACAGAALLLLR